jgi:hypothetical protein
VAYTASPSGRNEVYAVSFPEPAVTRQLSSDGAVQPRWSGDGDELFFLSIDQHMMTLPILDTESLRIGAPRSLFRLTRVQAHGAQGPGLYTLYDVDAGGMRFVVNAPPDDPGPPYMVVLNWTAALPRP